jgi:hypothetical protein
MNRQQELCTHYGMTPSRNTAAFGSEITAGIKGAAGAVSGLQALKALAIL